MLLLSNNLPKANTMLNSHCIVCEIAILLNMTCLLYVHVLSHVTEGAMTCFNKLSKKLDRVISP